MNTIQNKMTTTAVENTQLSNNTHQPFKSINTSSIIEVASNMINSGEVKTTIDFVNKFMFALDSEEPFPINIDMLVEEKIYDKKENATRALKKYFTEGTHYQVQNFATLQRVAETKKENRGGHNKKDITLTVDCFKAMCMIAQSAFGKQTQMYYLDLEKIFKKYITVEYKKQLILQQEEKNKIQLEYKVLEKKYNSSLKKHRYHKFKENGPSLYIIDCGLDYADGIHRIKIGIAGVPIKEIKDDGTKIIKTESIDKRLQSHRTLWPRLRMNFLLFTQDVALIEKSLKRIYSLQINPGGHEIIEGVKKEDVIKKTKETLAFLNIEEEEYRICVHEEVDKYNDNVLTTLKEDLFHEADEDKAMIEFIDEEIVEDKVTIEFIDEEIVEDKAMIKFIDEVVEEKDDLEKLTLLKLREVAKKDKITQVGRKGEIIDRIRKFRKTNKLEAHKNSKKIYQYGLDGVMIKEYESVKSASKILNLHEDMISNVLNNKNKTAHGYIWRDKMVELSMNELESITKHSKSIIVIQVMDDGREIKYDSMVEASKKTGLSVGVLERKIKKYKEGESGFRYSDIGQKKSQLSEEDIIEIKRKYNGGISVTDLEKEYGKSVKQLRRVITK